MITTTLCTTELDMANSVVTSNIDAFLTDVAWAICSTCHIFGRHMLFDIPFLANWNKVGEHRQHQTDLNMEWENFSCHDWDYQVGDKVLL